MTSLSERAPSQRYYAAMHGRWRGRLAMTLTDPSALGQATMDTLDRLVWRLTARSDRWLGAPWLETSVDYRTGAARNLVVHTTRLRQLGMPMVWGREDIRLDSNGGDFTLEGAHRFAWFPFSARAVHGVGKVADSSDGASYTLDYLGAKMTQTTRRDGEDALLITQTTAFSRAEVRLVRS